MKYLPLFLILIFATPHEPMDPVASGVYSWPSTLAEHAKGVKKGQVLMGSTSALEKLEVSAYQLSPGVTHQGASLPGIGSLVIVKSGEVTVMNQGNPVVLGPGSVQVLFPGDLLRIENSGDSNAAYYLFQYLARRGVEQGKSKEADSGSFVVDWNQLDVRETQRGEHRGYFDLPTPSFSRFEMHVTTLNEGLRSHDVHTHSEEEFLLVIQGQVEEHIDGTDHPATVGDLIFLDAMVPHTITNVGEGPAQYFAFKWE